MEGPLLAGVATDGAPVWLCGHGGSQFESRGRHDPNTAKMEPGLFCLFPGTQGETAEYLKRYEFHPFRGKRGSAKPKIRSFQAKLLSKSLGLRKCLLNFHHFWDALGCCLCWGQLSAKSWAETKRWRGKPRPRVASRTARFMTLHTTPSAWTLTGLTRQILHK